MDGFLKAKQDCIIILPAIFKISSVQVNGRIDKNDQNLAEMFEKREIIVKSSVLSLNYTI